MVVHLSHCYQFILHFSLIQKNQKIIKEGKKEGEKEKREQEIEQQ